MRILLGEVQALLDCDSTRGNREAVRLLQRIAALASTLALTLICQRVRK
jgi:hypothetical protein